MRMRLTMMLRVESSGRLSGEVVRRVCALPALAAIVIITKRRRIKTKVGTMKLQSRVCSMLIKLLIWVLSEQHFSKVYVSFKEIHELDSYRQVLTKKKGNIT